MTAAAVVEIGRWQCPHGKMVLTAGQQHTPEWYALRQQGIGGSDLAQILGEGAWGTTPYDVWLSKTFDTRIEETDNMHYGTVFEDAIAQDWAKQQGLKVRNVGTYVSRKYPHAFANPDRLTNDGGGLEVKTANAFTKLWSDGACPLQFVRQAEHCLLCTGRSHWWIMCVIGGQRPEMRLVVVKERWSGPYPDDVPVIVTTEAKLAKHGEFIEDWWTRHIIGGVAPEFGAPPVLDDIDPTLVVEAALPGLVLADVARAKEITQQKKDLEAELSAIKDRLGIALGSTAKYLAVNGQRVARWTERKGKNAIAYKAAVKAGDGAEKYITKGEPTRFITIMGASDDT